MPTSTDKGYSLAHVFCRGCGREAKLPPERVPPMSHERLRCTVCGHRGADIRYVWHVDPLPANVVTLPARKG